MTTYKIKETIDGVQYLEATTEEGIISFIPIDESNADYLAYLKRDEAKTE